jgi:SAM-dependent methyltransferase/uncharacterized protein YbaR (Trm112 family)
MRPFLHDLIRQPGLGTGLELASFDSAPTTDQATDVREGVLFDATSRTAYPIVDGVPLMLPNSFSQAFLDRHRSSIAASQTLSALGLTASRRDDWSFSRQWDEHFERGAARTWGYTVEERVEQLLMETDTAPDWFEGRAVLDAGCGTGELSQHIARLGATVVGLDYSSSVLAAERRRRIEGVHFIQGDLQAPPFRDGSFDLVFSIGVLHCTPSTSRTFQAVARLVKPGGRFYVWLYRRPERFLGRYLKVPAYDVARFFIARAPVGIQRQVVTAYARAVQLTHRLMTRDSIPLHEYVVSAYDDLTPRWRYYHTAIEVSRWFHEAGFRAPTLSHWDNPYGFGLVAVKEPRVATPGIHYGSAPKLWDDATTLLGRLHRD